jgi:hypothetical protein
MRHRPTVARSVGRFMAQQKDEERLFAELFMTIKLDGA